MPIRPRNRRDLERARRAAATARAQGATAMETALTQIGAAFDEAAMVNAFKLRVERLLRLGVHHPAVRARYGARAALLPSHDLDAAIAAVERWWRNERKAFQIASALGRGNALSLSVLSELRLILRLMRRKRMATELPIVIAALCAAPSAIAAE